MKKILVLHNRYQQLGGEDIAVDNEIKVLEKHFEIKTLYFENNIENIFSIALSFLINHNLKSTKILKEEIEKFKPEIVYVHNTWFKASLGIFSILKKNNIKTFIKLHNFRYNCTRSFFKSVHLGESNVCKACAMDNKKTLLFNRYFPDSLIKSIFVNIYGKKYYKILMSKNSRIFVLTDFHKNFLEIKKEFKGSVSVLKNPIVAPVISKQLSTSENYILYAGRLSDEKGVKVLIESFLNSKLKEFKLKIVGEGPLYSELFEKYKNSKAVEILGQMPNEKVLNLINDSKAVVTATQLYEGQPTLLSEASLLGVPSIFPKTGGISEFFDINYPLSYEQFNYKDLVEKLNLLLDLDLVNKTGIKNRTYIQNSMNEEIYIERFKNIIDE